MAGSEGAASEPAGAPATAAPGNGTPESAAVESAPAPEVVEIPVDDLDVLEVALVGPWLDPRNVPARVMLAAVYEQLFHYRYGELAALERAMKAGRVVRGPEGEAHDVAWLAPEDRWDWKAGAVPIAKTKVAGVTVHLVAVEMHGDVPADAAVARAAVRDVIEGEHVHLIVTYGKALAKALDPLHAERWVRDAREAGAKVYRMHVLAVAQDPEEGKRWFERCRPGLGAVGYTIVSDGSPWARWNEHAIVLRDATDADDTYRDPGELVKAGDEPLLSYRVVGTVTLPPERSEEAPSGAPASGPAESAPFPAHADAGAAPVPAPAPPPAELSALLAHGSPPAVILLVRNDARVFDLRRWLDDRSAPVYYCSPAEDDWDADGFPIVDEKYGRSVADFLRRKVKEEAKRGVKLLRPPLKLGDDLRAGVDDALRAYLAAHPAPAPAPAPAPMPTPGTAAPAPASAPAPTSAPKPPPSTAAAPR
ncbi:MAG TPA: hypothetical protein VG389_28130 [Myxococcota bacterium]|nr:hypothetical protein [Myxococcota bacterium]